MNSASPKVHTVNWEKITVEELQEYKMTLGQTQHGDHLQYTMEEMLADYTRKIGEFFVAMGSGDHRNSMECIADIGNVGDLLYPKLQEAYIEASSNEPPDCYGYDEIFNTLECRAKPCAWREDCGLICEATRAKLFKELTIENRNEEHSRLNE